MQCLTAVGKSHSSSGCWLSLEGSLPPRQTWNGRISWTPAHRDVNRPFLFYWRSERNIDAVIETRKLRLCLEPLSPSKTRIFVCLRETDNQQCRLIAHIWHLTSHSLQIYIFLSRCCNPCSFFCQWLSYPYKPTHGGDQNYIPYRRRRNPLFSETDGFSGKSHVGGF